jgi:hypothetical protein
MTTRFPDIESELMVWVDRVYTPTVPTATFVPSEWPAGDFTFVRVGCLGGQDNGITDFSIVDVEVFSNTYAAAAELAEDIRQGLVPRTRLSSATIDSVRTDSKPHEVPWQGASVRRSFATYQIATRR